MLFVNHKKLNLWLPVGGHLEDGETPEESLSREIKEEVNLDIDILDPYPAFNDSFTQHKPLYVRVGMEKGIKKIWYDYLCRAKKPNILKIKKDELRDYQWIKKTAVQGIDTLPLIKFIANLAFSKMS